MATRAAAGSDACCSTLCTADLAWYSMPGSSVVRTASPPAATRRAPKRATSCCSAQPEKFGCCCAVYSVPGFSPSGDDTAVANSSARDHAVREHRAQHVVPPPHRDRGMEERVVHRRRLRQPCEERRLREREVARAPREERLRAGLRAVRGAAVEHLVEVRGEDALLRPRLRELEREARFLHLARERPLRVAEIEVARELLRDRRAAFDDPAGGHVRVERAHDALVVERAVLPEAAVLDRDRRLREVRRHLVEPQRLPVRARRHDAEERAVLRVHERVLPEREGLERVQRARPEQHGATADGGTGDDRDDDERGGRERDGEPVAGTRAAQTRPAHEDERREVLIGTAAVPHGLVVARARARETTYASSERTTPSTGSATVIARFARPICVRSGLSDCGRPSRICRARPGPST